MTIGIRKELNQAKRLYQAGKRKEAYEIYNKHFSEHPEEFDRWDKIRYCWSIYYVFIIDSYDERQLEEYVEMVTDIVKQEDLNKNPVCVYTQCIFKMIMFLKSEQDWEYMLYWLDKLNPELLSEKQRQGHDVIYPSKKEEYYKFLSTAYLNCGDYEDCINVSKEVLDKLKDFAFNGDTWHRWRIAKSLRQLNRSEEALTYLEEVVKVQQDWFVFKEIAENYHALNDDENALKYASKAVLTNVPVKHKVNLFYLIYDILKESDYDLALKHAELYLALKLESGAPILSEIDELEIDEETLDINELEKEIRNYWQKSQN